MGFLRGQCRLKKVRRSEQASAAQHQDATSSWERSFVRSRLESAFRAEAQVNLLSAVPNDGRVRHAPSSVVLACRNVCAEDSTIRFAAKSHRAPKRARDRSRAIHADVRARPAQWRVARAGAGPHKAADGRERSLCGGQNLAPQVDRSAPPRCDAGETGVPPGGGCWPRYDPEALGWPVTFDTVGVRVRPLPRHGRCRGGTGGSGIEIRPAQRTPHRVFFFSPVNYIVIRYKYKDGG